MIATSSTTSPAGSSSSIAAAAFPTRATIRPGWSRSRSGCAQEGREDEARQRTLEREQEWIAASPKARQAKSKARIQRYEELVKKPNDKRTDHGADHHPGGRAARPERGRLRRHLSKGYGDRLLIDDLTFKLPPGGIVGVIGPNGAGKTTLFRMITGQEKPDAGTITIGESVQLGYVDQSRDALDGRQDRLGGDLRRQRHHSISASAR